MQNADIKDAGFRVNSLKTCIFYVNFIPNFSIKGYCQLGECGVH